MDMDKVNITPTPEQGCNGRRHLLLQLTTFGLAISALVLIVQS